MLKAQEAQLRRGMRINLAYGALKLAAGAVYQSLWFTALAVYYLLLAGLKLILVFRSPEGALSQWRRCRLCGGALVLMNQALAMVVYLVVRRGDSFEYPGVMIYGVACYTFYSLTVALWGALKVKKSDSPILAASRTIHLAAALVSLLALETGLLSQFGQPGEEAFRQWMTGLTGAGVCLSVLWMAVVMLKRAHRAIRVLKQGENHDE